MVRRTVRTFVAGPLGLPQLLLFLILAISRSSVGQQPLLQITSPADGSVVNPGGTISAIVTPAPGVTFTQVIVVAEDPIGFSTVATAAPFQFLMTVPSGTAIGKYHLTAIGTTGSGPEVYSGPVTIEVERADIPTALSAAPPQVTLESQGEQIPVHIRGTFSDGSLLDLTESSNLTYSLSNTGVATVNSMGMVTAVGAGTASLVATYAQTVHVSVMITLLSPVVTPSPTSLTFGNQPLGTSSGTQTLTLTNTSNGALGILGVAATDDFAETDDCVSSSPIAAVGTCAINVTFRPTANGMRTGGLNITDSFSVVPVTVSLTGIGVGAAVGLSPESVSFDSQGVGTTSAAQTVTLTNTGSAALTVTSLAASAAFAETDNCASSSPIAAGGVCTINVAFNPATPGTATGTLAVNDTAGDSPQSVALMGFATAPPATSTAVTAPPITYGTNALITVAVTSGSGTVTGMVALSADGGSPFSQTLSDGSAVFTLPGLAAGKHSLSATYSAQGSFGASSGTGTLVVNLATPTITWSAPPAINFGSALSSTQLDATASVPGTFVYNLPVGTVPPVGTGQTLSVTFTPNDTTDYTNATATTTINVNPAAPSASPADLVVTHVLTRIGGNVVVQLTIANTGGTAAGNVVLTGAKVGSDTATPLTQSIGTVGAGASATATVSVPGSVGASGAASSLTVSGTYTGGTFSSSARITLP